METTEVKFYREPMREILAVFPKHKERNGYRNDLMECYSHTGQHSTCAPEYLKKCRRATPEQYADLKRELETYPYNYNLKVI